MLGVSVVIPCYNAAKFLRETLDSVLCPRYDGPLEVLVADDGSQDGSPRIVDSYGPRYDCSRGRARAPIRLLARNRCPTATTTSGGVSGRRRSLDARASLGVGRRH